MNLSPEGQRLVEDVAYRHGFSTDAVTHMLMAVAQGNGTQAQFSHPEFGGMGQWSQGGMIMIGDMFNNALKARVDGLCSELSRELGSRSLWAAPASSQRQSQSGGMPGMQSQQQGGGFGGSDVSLFVGGGSGNWWPADLGSPSSTGAQNDLRYAYFPAARRLAIDIHGKVTVYDTGDHQIGGVSQQQSGDASFTFTSQRGLVRVADLPVVSGPDGKAKDAPPAPTATVPPQAQAQAPVEPAPRAEQAPATPVAAAEPEPRKEPAPPAPPAAAAAPAGDDIFAKLEKLAELHSRGVLSAEEFQAKKTELLSRL